MFKYIGLNSENHRFNHHSYGLTLPKTPFARATTMIIEKGNNNQHRKKG